MNFREKVENSEKLREDFLVYKSKIYNNNLIEMAQIIDYLYTNKLIADMKISYDLYEGNYDSLFSNPTILVKLDKEINEWYVPELMGPGTVLKFLNNNFSKYETRFFDRNINEEIMFYSHALAKIVEETENGLVNVGKLRNNPLWIINKKENEELFIGSLSSSDFKETISSLSIYVNKEEVESEIIKFRYQGLNDSINKNNNNKAKNKI